MAGNTTPVVRTFVIDTVAPVTTVSFPAVNLDAYNAQAKWNDGLTGAVGDAAGCTGGGGLTNVGDICGTVIDALSNVSSVTWTLQRANDSRYWNAGSSTWPNTTPVNNSTSIAGSRWSAALPYTAISAQQTTYTLTITGTDAPGNSSASTVRTFRFDTTIPTVTPSFPVHNGIYQVSDWVAGCAPEGFCGVAADTLSGVAEVQISLRRGTTSGNYWDGSGFNSASEVFLSVSGTTSWTYAFQFDQFPDHNFKYRFRLKAIDAAGNESAPTNRDFTIDRTRTCTLVAVADTYADQAAANQSTNFGTLPTMAIRSFLSGATPLHKRAFVRFDVTQCSPSISGATISSSSLRLFQLTVASNNRTYGVYRVTDGWSETALTWANMPAFNPTVTTTTQSNTTANQARTYVVTTDVAAWASGTSNFGWMLKDQQDSQTTEREGTFASRESATQANRPALSISYVPVP